MSVVWHCRVLDHPEIAGEAVVHDEDDEDDDGSGPMNDEQVPGSGMSECEQREFRLMMGALRIAHVDSFRGVGAA